MCYCLQMVVTDTPGVLAKVIDLETFGDFAARNLVCESMSKIVDTVYSQTAIATAGNAALPLITRLAAPLAVCRANALPEANELIIRKLRKGCILALDQGDTSFGPRGGMLVTSPPHFVKLSS